ncbi:MAG: hypothetical protein ABIQ51_03810 [Mesorhizobium sp.]
MVRNRRREKARKLVQSIFSLFFLTQFASAASTDIASKENSELAIKYIGALPLAEKIFVWPAWGRLYEILGSDGGINQAVGRYENLGSRPFYLTRFWGPGAQISIISISSKYSFPAEIEALLSQSRLLKSYKDFLRKAELSNDGCTAYKFTSRQTWASVGIVVIGQKELEEKGQTSRDLCVQGALDYIDGFPLPVPYFSYSSLPNPDVRGMIMKAIGQCAAEGFSDLQPPETSRDDITALPTLSCVRNKIAR